jgi:ribosomal protein S18 acetylase RimI-like enzyme
MFRIHSSSPSEFLSTAAPVLTSREAENNLLLGLADRASKDAQAFPGAVWLTVHEGDELVGAAVRTPPYEVTVTRLPPGAARTVADFFLEREDVPDGATGPGRHAHDVAAVLAERTGGVLRHRMADTLYELTELLPPRLPPGAARLAVTEDLATVTRYFKEFYAEVDLPHSGDPEAAARGAIARGWMLLWDDDGPRSFAGSSRSTPSGASIGPVYTPPESRGRGYASALTAELTRRLLDGGKRFVCLFADQQNRTSNHIYQSLGFRALGDFNVWTVTPRP